MKKRYTMNATKLLIMGIAAVIGLAGALYLCLSPQFRRQEIHKCATTNENWQTGTLTETEKAVQEFLPQKTELVRLAVWVNHQDDPASKGVLRLTVYDTQGHSLAVCDRETAGLTSGAWEWFDVNVKITVGETYYFSLEIIGEETSLTAVYRPLWLDRIEENVQYFYDGELIEGASAACQYCYRLPLTITEICIYTAFSLFFTFAVGELIYRAMRKRHKSER